MKKVVIIFLFFILINKIYADKIELKDVECVDGDTIKALINNKKETIRFLGIDTPETIYSTKDKDEPYAKEASEYTCNKISNNKVELEYDDKSDMTDKYGRILGWIFINDNLLQKELVSLGYAKVKYIYDDYKYVEILKNEEKLAKDNKLGIWSDSKYEEVEEDDESVIEKIVDKIVDLLKRIIKNLYDFIKNLFKD